ncbi:hypothetical protein FDP41_005389 [Naegleria fowleri]|uniref:EF-hand domain-containing protein n=1 Tax=Naegleria fowleri TaxID=5763 RepID=A0A6A5BPC0_NAEFO|nr:uncharacterized protein FDP41_005389 [Naegleria fowleri]KAF0975395.1 hypothetical protein FDP41_005389 [Naegleria fowleri]CAG4708864.1 unnamed protein product [Naegleria fowleri]
MGNGISKDEMKLYQEQTKNRLTKKDIQRYFKFWHELFPDGNMTREGFSKFAQIALPSAPPDADVEYLFRAMDANKDGTITFKEFLFFQSITAPTTQPLQFHELIDLAFDMYDEDNDGFVTAEEMRDSLRNMFKAKGMNVNSPDIERTINTRIENLLKIADSNGDGKLTREEIVQACQKDPSLLVLF